MWLDDETWIQWIPRRESHEEWPKWFKLLDEPILTTDVGVWYSTVVLPRP